MRLNTFILNESVFTNALKKIEGKPSKTLEKFLKSNFNDFMNILKDKVLEDDALNIINKRLGTHYTSLKELSLAKIMEGVEINEDFSHYWDLIKKEAFPALAFYPALQVWLELDKVLRANSVNSTSIRIMAVYAAIWLFLVSGKYIKSWRDWKKNSPDEYEKQKEVK